MVRRDDAAATSSSARMVTTGSATPDDGVIGIAAAYSPIVDVDASFAFAVRGSPERCASRGEWSSLSTSTIEPGRSQREVARPCDEHGGTNADEDGNRVVDESRDAMLKPLPVFEGLRIGASTRLGVPPTDSLAPTFLHGEHGCEKRPNRNKSVPTPYK